MENTSQGDIFGTDPHKLHRRGEVDTSVQAAHTVDSAGWELKMYEHIVSCGNRGSTPKHALESYPNAPYSTITARFSALKEKRKIFDTGLRVDRSAILVADVFRDQWEWSEEENCYELKAGR